MDRTTSLDRDAGVLADAIKEFFGNRSQVSRRQLRQLFHIGRVSLSIGLAFLALSIGVGDVIASALSGLRVGALLSEGLLIRPSAVPTANSRAVVAGVAGGSLSNGRAGGRLGEPRR